MSESATEGRPHQVTLAGWISVLLASFAVLGLFERIRGLRSIEAQEGLERCLSGRRRNASNDCLLTRPALEGLGLDVDGALYLLQTIFVVTGGLAAAAGVLGWFVLRRHKQARIGLSVLAVPLFVTGFLSGSFAVLMLVVAATLLWSGPARDWFAGRPVRKPPMLFGGPAGTSTHAPSSEAPAPDAASRVDAPHLPPTPPGVASAAPPPYAGYGAPRIPSVPAPVVARPLALIAAAAITWVSTALVVLIFGAAAAIILADPDAIIRASEQQPWLQEEITRDQLREAVPVCVVFVGWALAAALLALLAMLRVAWAMPLWLASAVSSGLVSILSASAILPVLTAAAGMVVTYLLVRPEVRRWISKR